MRRHIATMALALLALTLGMPTADAGDAHGLVMPFPAGESWDATGPNGTAHHFGGYDVSPPPDSLGLVVAVGSGLVALMCATPGGQAILLLEVPGYPQFQYGHVDSDYSAALMTPGQWYNVQQGQTIGKVWTNPTGSYGFEQDGGGCTEGTSPYRHLHFNATPGLVYDGQALGQCNPCEATGNGNQPPPTAPPPPAPHDTTAADLEPTETVAEWWARLFPNEVPA